MDSVFDGLEDKVDEDDKEVVSDLTSYVRLERRRAAFRRAHMTALHMSLSIPRVLDDEDLCIRDGYRDIVSMYKEMQMAGRTLSAARADQYDPEGFDEVDPTTRPDYSYMDAVDDAKRVSERLKAQADSSQAPETPETQAPETQAPETPSSPAP